MTNTEVIKILENERECVYRAKYCNRHCNTCDLVMKDIDIIEAYDKAIHQINNISKYRKSAKRFKRKYIFLKLAIKRAMNEMLHMAEYETYTESQANVNTGIKKAYNTLLKNLSQQKGLSNDLV